MTKLFDWQMENTLTADYSAGDSSGTGSGTYEFDGTTKHDGSYSLKALVVDDMVLYDVVSLDIVKNTGCIKAWVRFNGAIAANINPVYVTFDGSNELYLNVTNIASTLYAGMTYIGGGASVYPDVDANTIVVADTWYEFIARWRTGTTNPSLSFQLGTGTAITVDTDLTAWTTTTGLLRIGNYGVSSPTVWVDNLRIYDDWDGTEGGPQPPVLLRYEVF